MRFLSRIFIQSRKLQVSPMQSMILLVFLTFSITFAQILMKYAAQASNQNGIWDQKVLLLVAFSFFVSCAGQLIWFYVLKTASISTSYMFLALVFVFVPAAGYFLFDEKISHIQSLAIAFILIGVAIQGYAGTR